MPPERTAGTTRPGSPSSCGTARRGRRRLRPEVAAGTLRALPIRLHRFFSTTYSSVGYGLVRVRGEQQACRPMASGEAGAEHPGGARRSHSSPAHRRPGHIRLSSHFYKLLRALVARSMPGFRDCWPILAVDGGRRDRYPRPGRVGDQAAFDVFEKGHPAAGRRPPGRTTTRPRSRAAGATPRPGRATELARGFRFTAWNASSNGSSSEEEGITSIQTAEGKHVECLERGKHKVVETGTMLASDDLDVP